MSVCGGGQYVCVGGGVSVCRVCGGGQCVCVGGQCVSCVWGGVSV